MIAIDTPELIAQLVARGSHCEIVRLVTDDERGDRVEVRCGAAAKALGHALKGLSLDKISECQVVVTLNAVNVPKLLGVDNCGGSIRVNDLGRTWVAKLRMKNGVIPSRLDYVSYEKSSERAGCYKVTITYDAVAGSQNTAFVAKSEEYCLGNSKR
jgi:hypothetical protein